VISSLVIKGKKIKGTSARNWRSKLEVDDVFEFRDIYVPVSLMLRVADDVKPKICWVPPNVDAAVVLSVPALGDCDVRDVSPEWAGAIRGIDEFKRRQSD